MTYLLAYFAVLNLCDAWTTWQVLKLGGIEANPVLAWSMKNFGVALTLAVFKITPVVVVWALWKWFALPAMVMAVIDIAYTALIASNLYQLRKQKQQ